MEIRPIAYYHCPLQSRFGVPRQSGLADDLEGRIVFEPEFRREEALRGLLGDGGFNRIWLIWGFSANRETASSWQPLVRPPRLGGNASMGVFATRSPYRPNPLGLSTVSLVRIEDCELHVQGADLMDGTPIYDIKPYIVYADSHPEASRGFVPGAPEETLEVLFEVELPLSEKEKKALREVLALDPRPAYQDDPDRTYGLPFSGYDIRFNVTGGFLRVVGFEVLGDH